MQIADSAVTSGEIELLDLLIVIAENLKLLVIVPLLIGLAALGAAFFIPPTFESQSILNPNKAGVTAPGQLLASYIKSADVMKTVANELQFEPAASTEQRYKHLEKLVSVSVGKQDQLVTLKTQGASPERARLINTTIWKHVLPLTIPRSTELTRLQTQLQSEKERLQSSERLEASTAKLLSSGHANAEGTARLYGELLTANSARLSTIATLEAQLEGLTEENLAQQATLPDAAIKPKKALIAVAAVLGSGCFLLLFVFVRHALGTARQDADLAGKIHRIRCAVGLKD